MEAEAITAVLTACESDRASLVASVALNLENERNPDPERKRHLAGLLAQAKDDIQISPEIEQRTRTHIESGVKGMDALHLACAVAGDADDFCTCDDRFLKRARAIVTGETKVVSPLELLTELGL